MSTIRIIRNCTEFGRQFTAGQLTSLMSPLHDAAMVLSRLATYTDRSDVPAFPAEGMVPLTSVQFASPNSYGLNEYWRRTYEFNGHRFYWDGTQLVPYGVMGLIVLGEQAVGAVRTARLFGGYATGFQWFLNGVAIAGANDISPDGTVSTYVMTAGDMVDDSELTCEATGFVPVGFGGVAGFAAPDLEAPAYVGPPAAGTLVSYAAGPVTGIPAPVITFEAMVNGRPVDLPFTPGAEDAGKLLTVTQVVTNKHGTSRASVNAFIQYALVAPAVISPPVITNAAPIAGDALTFTAASFSGSGGPIVTQWQTGLGVDIPGANSTTFVAPSAGQYIVTQTQTNGAGSATATSAVVTVTAGPVDLRPRFATGPANAWEPGNSEAFIDSMTPLTGSVAGGKAGTFTIPAIDILTFGWAAFEPTVSAGGVTFTDALGTGGWDGAGLPSVNAGVSGSLSTVSVLAFDSNGTQWRLFRMDYQADWVGSAS